MTTQHVSVTVNGTVREADVEPRLLLVHLLRDRRWTVEELASVRPDLAAAA